MLRKLSVITTISLLTWSSVSSADYTRLEPAADAAKSVAKMQVLMGNWHCKRQILQQDGTWQIPEQVSRWEWRYILNGHAIQDYWYPQAKDLSAPGMGTNMRIYNPKTDKWLMTWTFDKLARFQDFEATFDEKLLVMNGDYPASAQRPAHKAKITFHNISDKHFDWKYESSNLDDGKNWLEVFRLNCDKVE
ncbi:MAG: hypothetical protein HWE16_11935 [Gammaproteobacteria bacterium]|nr:hypothetical protein [Gammaproteobacteria bacterium]